MKTRRREVISETVYIPSQPYTHKHVNCVGDVALTATNIGPYAANTVSLKEAMSGSTGRGQPHQVVHRKVSRQIYRGPEVFKQGASGPGSGHEKGHAVQEVNDYSTFVNWEQHEKMTYHVGLGLPWAWQNTLVPPGLSDLPPDWLLGPYDNSIETKLKNDVIERARQLKADVLLNLIEANQIVPSLRSILTVASSIKRGDKGVGLRTSLKQLSGGYLAWKFGIKPIISDLHNIWSFLPTIKKAYDKHSNQTPQRFSVKTEIPVLWSNGPNKVAGKWPADLTVNGHKWWTFSGQGRVIKTPTVRYVLVVKPRPLSTGVFKALDFALSRFATSPASLAYERIPFSFVLDWFVDVRGALRGLDNLVGFKPFEVVSFTRSLSYHLATDTFLELHATCDDERALWSGPCGTEGYSHYERSLVSMSGDLPVFAPRFGKNQAAISVALLTQILANRKG